MKRLSPVPVLLSVLLSVSSIWPQGRHEWSHGQVLEGLTLKSGRLQQEVKYAVYLPPDYNTSARRYPVVYLLHGFTDDETAWIQFGEVNVSADQLISHGEIPALIIVMPDAGLTWYVDDFSGKVPYETMFITELIPAIDEKFRTRTKKEFRSVAGLSMGGYGSLMLAMKHPDTFAACAAFSSGVLTDREIRSMSDREYTRLFAASFGPAATPEERLTPHWRDNNPLDLAKTLPTETLKKVRWYLDCGDDDFLYRGNAALHTILRNRRIPHEYRVRDGGHRWVYWRTGIRDGLRFIGESFHR